jgi:putative flippase GtrA
LQIIKYFFVGGTAAVVNVGTFFIFAKLLGFHYLVVNFFGFMLATLVNYVLSIKFVFQSGKRHKKKKEISLVYLVSALGLALDTLFLYLFIEIFIIEMMIAKIISTGLVFFWNYGARKYFVF